MSLWDSERYQSAPEITAIRSPAPVLNTHQNKSPLPALQSKVPELREVRTHRLVWHGPVMGARLGRAGQRLDKPHGDG